MANGITYGINFPFIQSEKGNYLKLTETTDEEIRANIEPVNKLTPLFFRKERFKPVSVAQT